MKKTVPLIFTVLTLPCFGQQGPQHISPTQLQTIEDLEPGRAVQRPVSYQGSLRIAYSRQTPLIAKAEHRPSRAVTVGMDDLGPPTSAIRRSLEASISPITPLIEIRGQQQNVNVDLLIRNRGAESYQLIALRLAVFDQHGKLEMERELNENGTPPALPIVGDLALPAAGAIDLYQPFTTFDRSLDLSTMRFTLLFGKAGQNAAAIPLTSSATVIIDVHPKNYAPTPYCLPLTGLVVVHDGHDLLSHHRRFNLAHRLQADPAKAVSANLYAYDFMRTGPEGALYGRDLTRKEDWFSYGASVRAPEAGTIVRAANDIPENTLDSTGNSHIPPAAETKDPNGFGNYVAIRHSDGRVSWLLHMQPGSVTVHTGNVVHAGQVLGKIGFSGDSLFPHLHYNVTNAPSYPAQGVPSYFRDFTRVLGSRRVDVSEGQIDTGDLVDSDGSCGQR
ncbi:MAG: M23 family metallopeptidase [Acidobacteriota bacterium]|nr:M23 family metallopeptidase [Acidobacteriota bacterium]